MCKREENIYTTGAEKIVAYFDLLGFSSYCKFDENDKKPDVEYRRRRNGAEGLISGLNVILKEKKNDESSLPPEDSVSTFEYFLPFSDCVLIIAPIDKADLFVKQISNFIYNVFYLNEHAYVEKEFEKKPIEQRVKNVKNKCSYMENWYPFMWRGGVTVGDVKIVKEKINSIINSKLEKTMIALGKGVVEAVRLEEKSGRGPRIFCSERFVDLLGNGVDSSFICKSENVYDLLWPKILKDADNKDFVKAVKNLKELMEHDPNADDGIKDQYRNFLELIRWSGIDCRDSSSFNPDNLRK